MVVCGVLLLASVVAAVAWSGGPFLVPAPAELPPVELPPVEVARRFAWYAALMLTGGALAGIAVIGAGGRLAMRLLAVTAGAGAQGRITEADEVVGRITVDGTISFVLFNGIFGGVAAAGIYLVVRRVLPAGWLGGIAFGLALLLILGTTIDPLRESNPDFDIVGPGWLAVLVFGALAVTFGLVLAAVLARLSAWLPLLTSERRVLVRYAGPAVLAAVAVSVSVVLLTLCLVVVAVTRWRPVLNVVRSSRWVMVGRMVVVALVVVSLPGAVASMVEIARR